MSEDLYRPPQTELLEPGALQTLAERGTRLIASIVDGLMILPGLIPVIWSLEGAGEDADPSSVAIGFAIVWILGVLGINLVFIAQSGQTIAKRWFKIRVVRSDGSPISLGRYVLLRVLPVQFASAIPFLGNFVALGNAVAIFRESRKCLHDDIADTIVVQTS